MRKRTCHQDKDASFLGNPDQPTHGRKSFPQQKLLEPCCGVGIPGIFDSERRLYAEQLLKRVVNQNEQARGLFYLHQDADAGIATPSVALLRVTIALRRDHYEMLQRCRCGRLGSEYAAKLGWLTGNLYSRVATRDWEEQEEDPLASAKQAQSLLRRTSRPSNENCENWVPAKWVKAAREKKIDLNNIPVERFRSILAEHAPPDLLAVVLDSVRRVGNRVVVDQRCDEVSVRLAGHDEFVGEVVQAIAGFCGGLLSSDEQVALKQRLATDGEFRKAIGDQVANLLKRKAVETDLRGVEELPNVVTTSVGKLVPRGDRLRVTLSGLLGGDRAKDVDQIVESVARGCVFRPAATEIAAREVREVFRQVDFGLLDKLISRLSNDQKLRAASRGQGEGQTPPALLPD